MADPIVGPNTATFSAGQTASGVASSLGMTPAQFLSYNPELKATGFSNDYKGLTGLVNEGQSYRTGPTSSQIITTSNPSRTNMAQNLSLYDKAVAGLGPVDNKPTPPPAAGADPIIAGLQRLQTSSDAMTKSLLASTMASYQNQINQAQQQGENYKLGLESLGIRTGAASTTPDLLSGHIQAAANQTLQIVGNIKAEQNKALLEIQSAKEEGDFKRIQTASDRYRQLKEDERKAISDMRDSIEFGQKQLTTQASEIITQLNSIVDPVLKQKYIEEVAKKNGVSPIDVVAAINKERERQANLALDQENQRSLIANRGSSGGSTSPLSILDIARYNDLYPGAGVTAGDTEAQANAKIALSNTPEAQTRNLVMAAKDGGAPYEEALKEAGDNQADIDIVNEVYGMKGEKDKNAPIGEFISAPTGREVPFKEPKPFVDFLYDTLFKK